MQETRNPDTELTAAVQLGWRLAELYARVNDTGDPTRDTLLPAHDGLAPPDQLELQLRAAAGDARRTGADSAADRLERLVPQARAAAAGGDAESEEFRRQIRDCHVELNKSLWARDEGLGTAYELGNGLSDTYGRVCRAYREPTCSPRTTWLNVFAPDRIERIKKLMDDLEMRLDSRGVTIVRAHLDAWSREVPRRLEATDAPPVERVRCGLRRQTIVWRQLIAGDKAPEAYLDSRARGEVRGVLRHLVWRRCRNWVLPGAAVLFGLVAVLPAILAWYDRSPAGTTVASAVVALGGALGITKASVLLTVRTRAHDWSALLWDQALAQKVSAVTLAIDEVLPQPVEHRRPLAGMAAGLRRPGAKVMAQPNVGTSRS
jgi:hypothetical protein